MDFEQHLYAIGEVANITGVKPITLRAWQRRYNLLQPQRTDKGHRLYTLDDINQIKKVQSWLAKGVSIGKVKHLLTDNTLTTESMESQQLSEVSRLLESLVTADGRRVEKIIEMVLKEYPVDVVEQRFIIPVLQAIDLVKAGKGLLQLSLFRTSLIKQVSWAVKAHDKLANKKKHLFVNLDQTGDPVAWIRFLGRLEEGDKVILCDGLEDLSALCNHEISQRYLSLELFCQGSLTEKQLGIIASQLSHFYQDIRLSAMIHHQMENLEKNV